MRDIQILECSIEDRTRSAFQHMNLLHAKIDQLRILSDSLIRAQVEESIKDLKDMESNILQLQDSLINCSAPQISEETQTKLQQKVEVYAQMVRKVEALTQSQVDISYLIKSIRQHAFDLEVFI